MPPLVREDRIVILTTGSRTTRAGHGIHELFQRPSVQVATRVGRRREVDGNVAAAASSSPAAVEYIVGAELDNVIARREPIDVIYPIRNGRVRDWDALLALWRYVLLQRLGVRTTHNDCPLLVSLPPTLSREDHANATRILFENFNVPSLTIAEEALLSAYAAGSLTTTVVDFGWEHCTVSPVMENIGIVYTAVQRSDVGMRHVALYLAHLLGKDESVVQALIKLDATRSARQTDTAADGAIGRDAGDTLALRLFELATELINDGKVRAAVQGARQGSAEARKHQEEEAEFDIAAALVAGREKAAIEEQERKNRAAIEASEKHGEEIGIALPEGAENIAADADEAQKGASDEEGAETVSFQGLRIRVAPAPLLQACEPLWDPSVLLSLRGKLAQAASMSLGAYDLGTTKQAKPNGDFDALRSLPETIASSISSASDVDRRPQLWESLLPTGAPLKLVNSLNTALITASQGFLASNADNAPGTTANPGYGGGAISSGIGSTLASAGPTSRDSPGIGGDIEGGAQPTTARCIKTPDYFAEFKDRTDLAPFLGATIYAKLAFTDPYSRLTTSKAVYNEKGPSASFLVSAPS